MKTLVAMLALLVAFAAPVMAGAQVPVQADPSQERMLQDPDPKLAASKKLVYDFWREVLEAGHMDLAEKYMAESYVQHNPNVPTGRAAFVDFFSKQVKPKPIDPRVKAPLVAIVADGDLVVLSFVRSMPEPQDSTKTYTTTWFDMFRVTDAKIAEHWDSDTKD